MNAIILAGGKGERLRPLTNDRPKCMVMINDKPLIQYQIEWFKKSGIKKIVFACGYLHEVIEDYFEDGKKFGIEVKYSIENEPLGRGGALKKAWELISTPEPIVVTNGDIYTELNLIEAIKVHSLKKLKATICIFPFKSQYGIINFDANSIVQSFEEKPILPFWINGGVYILNNEIKSRLPEKGDHETTVFPELAKEKQMYAYRSSELWMGVDTIKDLTEFEKYFQGT